MRNPASFLAFLAVLALATPSADAGGGKRRKHSASLKGGKVSQTKQNGAADRLDLTRLKDRAQLEKFISAGLLVPVSGGHGYSLDPDLGSLDPGHEADYRHARAWTKSFLDRELGACHDATGDDYKVTSLVRTKAYQAKLRGVTKAAIAGRAWWKQSSHPTGATADISFEGLSKAGMRCLRDRLLELSAQGKVVAIEETHNGHFHVMVLPSYEKKATAKKTKPKKKSRTKRKKTHRKARR